MQGAVVPTPLSCRGTVIGAGSEINKAIIAENVHIGSGVRRAW